MLWSCYIF
uniref:Uncharacterized protein n=1 Tax=Arundo donax TaxID=35708 RepID=A0A0A8YJQ8_ARUDO